jgi:hypothetical protein
MKIVGGSAKPSESGLEGKLGGLMVRTGTNIGDGQAFASSFLFLYLGRMLMSLSATPHTIDLLCVILTG